MENPTDNKSEAAPVTRNYENGLTTAEAFAMVRKLREAGFLVLCLTPHDLMQKHADRVQDAEDDGEHSEMPKHHRKEMTYQEAAEALRDEEEAISSWTDWSEDTLQAAIDVAMASRDSEKAAKGGAL